MEPKQAVTSTTLRGAGAGFLAAFPQAALGELEERLFLPPGEDADIAPRTVHRLSLLLTGHRLSSPAKWVLGTAYHFGYGAAWGIMYAHARERVRFGPVLGGLLLGAVIYGITYPRWGMGVLIGAERPPGERSRRMTAVAWSVAVGFGIATAAIYERLRRPARAASIGGQASVS
ncbi:MAG TPA: hypothetical protein VF212_15720 [Longimicrobiales bacterium]